MKLVQPGKHILRSAALGDVNVYDEFNIKQNPVVIIDKNFAIVKFDEKEIAVKIV